MAEPVCEASSSSWVDRVGHERLELHLLEVELELSHVDPGHVEERGDELLEPLPLPLRRGEHALDVLGRQPLERLTRGDAAHVPEREPERGERSAQLVGGDRQELVACRDGALRLGVEPRVLDRLRRAVGEVLEQRLVLGGVRRTAGVAHQGDVPEHLVPLRERRDEQARHPLEIRPVLGLHLVPHRLPRELRDPQRPPARERARGDPLVRALRGGGDDPAAERGPLRRRVVHRDRHEPGAVRRDDADERAVADELRQPPRDGVERRLVVEPRGEHARRLGERLEPHRLTAQRLLGPRPFGDVEPGRDDGAHLAGVVEERGVAPRHEPPLAVAREPVVLVLRGELAGEEPAERGAHPFALLGQEQVPHRLPEHLAGEVPGDPSAGRVPAPDPPLAVEHHHERGGLLDHGLRERALLQEVVDLRPERRGVRGRTPAGGVLDCVAQVAETVRSVAERHPGPQYSNPLPPMNSRRIEVGGTWSG